MPYLIDGHNLIKYIPDITLEDEHDEAKLVSRLKSFVAGKGRGKCVVIFDQGLPGGISKMSTKSVEVIFAASSHSTADELIIKRLHKIRDKKAWFLVTADQAILSVAHTYGIQSIPPASFAEQVRKKSKPVISLDEQIHIHLSEAEIEDWIHIFKDAPNS
ncbi:NYN domain-containing protein [Anaerolineales bacterium]